MIDLGEYEFNILNIGQINPEESFINSNAGEIHESEQVSTSTKILRVILDAKYKREDLNKGTKNQFQHLTETQHNQLLKLFKIVRVVILNTWSKENRFSRLRNISSGFVQDHIQYQSYTNKCLKRK